MGIDQFLHWISDEKRFSRHTVTAYRKDLKEFEGFIEQQYEQAGLLSVKPVMIRSWLVSLKESGMTNSSINRKLSAIRSFYGYCQRNDMIQSNPAEKLVSLKKTRRLPSFATQETMKNATSEEVCESFGNIRDKLVIDILYHTGIRLSELVHLKESDIDIYQNQLTVTGKGNKQRIIPFHHQLKETVRQYTQLKRNMFEHQEASLIVTDKGRQAYDKMIYRIVHKFLTTATTLEKASPHVLRHTFATHLLNNGANILAIKELLGHSSLAATQVYTHNTIEQLKKIHQQAHPKG
jgi:integrase/recombinase XerC